LRQVVATVISNEQLWGEHRVLGHLKFLGAWLIWLKCPEIASEAKPGQFIMVNCGEECLLPRPFSIHQVSDDGIALFYAVLVSGKGTSWLSRRKKGDTIKLPSPHPLGNGFSIVSSSKNLLLVAGGNGIAPLYFLAQDALKGKRSVTLLYGTVDNKRRSIPPHIKLVSATEDGTVGHRGMITDLLPDYINWADQVFACGPLPMYQAMAHMSELKNKPVQISLEVRMGCGLGVCYGCTVKTRSGLKQVCKEGPIFELDDVLWEELADGGV
jgi:dihydroorotate dehydrogenase electron transfer subunit